jgi:hypothetical protein
MKSFLVILILNATLLFLYTISLIRHVFYQMWQKIQRSGSP